MSSHIVPRKTYVMVYAALMALLGLTLGLAYLDLGWASTPVALLIAAVKAWLVALFFMHLRYERGIVRVLAVAGLVWLAILMGLTLTDYRTRGWLELPGNWPAAKR